MDTTRDLKAVSHADHDRADRAVDCDSAHPTQFASAGVVVLVDTYERTADGTSLRYAGDAPAFVAGVTDADALRSALLGAHYRRADVERVLDGEHELTGERGRAAVRAAGGDVSTVAADGDGGRAVATDGGHDEDGAETVTSNVCMDCGATGFVGDCDCGGVEEL